MTAHDKFSLIWVVLPINHRHPLVLFSISIWVRFLYSPASGGRVKKSQFYFVCELCGIALNVVSVFNIRYSVDPALMPSAHKLGFKPDLRYPERQIDTDYPGPYGQYIRVVVLSGKLG